MRLVDADVVKTELDAWAVVINKPKYYLREDALYVIDTLQTIDAEPVKHGEWIIHRSTFEQYQPTEFECNQCGEKFTNMSNANYCPNCGAKMDKGE